MRRSDGGSHRGSNHDFFFAISHGRLQDVFVRCSRMRSCAVRVNSGVVSALRKAPMAVLGRPRAAHHILAVFGSGEEEFNLPFTPQRHICVVFAMSRAPLRIEGGIFANELSIRPIFHLLEHATFWPGSRELLRAFAPIVAIDQSPSAIFR